MPYKLRKVPKQDLYWVVSTETGKKHSNIGLPLKKAEAQMRALYRAMRLEGSGGTHKEHFIKEHGLEDKSYSLKELSSISKVPMKILREVYNRGIGAYKTQPSSVRLKGSYVKGVNAPMSAKLSKEQWAMARVYSFLDGNKKHDNDLRKNTGSGTTPSKVAPAPEALPAFTDEFDDSDSDEDVPPVSDFEAYLPQTGRAPQFPNEPFFPQMGVPPGQQLDDEAMARHRAEKDEIREKFRIIDEQIAKANELKQEYELALAGIGARPDVGPVIEFREWPYTSATKTPSTVFMRQKTDWERENNGEYYKYLKRKEKADKWDEVAKNIKGEIAEYEADITRLQAQRDVIFQNQSGYRAKGKFRNLKKKLQGAGLWDIVKDAFNPSKVINEFVNPDSAVRQRVSDVSKGVRKDYPPSSRKTIDKYGDWMVVDLRLRRDAVQSAINTAFNVITMGAWSKAKEQENMDKLFHLGLIATVWKNAVRKDILIEKNEVINVGMPKKVENDSSFLRVAIPEPQVSLREFLANGEAMKPGGDFFKYDPFTNNCQDFVALLLSGNNVYSEEARNFVKQDVSSLISRLPSYTHGVARGITDLGAVANVALEGGRLRGGVDAKALAQMKGNLGNMIDFQKRILLLLKYERQGPLRDKYIRLLHHNEQEMLRMRQAIMEEEEDVDAEFKDPLDDIPRTIEGAEGFDPEAREFRPGGAGKLRGGFNEAYKKAVISHIRDKVDNHFWEIKDVNNYFVNSLGIDPDKVSIWWAIIPDDIHDAIDENTENRKMMEGELSEGEEAGADEEEEEEEEDDSGMFSPRPSGAGKMAGTATRGNPKFERQLKKAGLDTSSYLAEARRRAKIHHYPYKLLGFATDGEHKLAIPDENGRVVSFGRVGYGDHLIYSHMEKAGSVASGTADKKQSVFHKSHSKIKGDWKSNPFSANNLALKILW